MGIEKSKVQRWCCCAAKWLALGGLLVAASIMRSGAADAAIVDVARYQLGEPGTIVGGNPQDSIGGHHFQNVIGSPATITPGALAGSTTAIRYTPNSGSYFAAPGTTVIPNDNVAIEMWVRTNNAAQSNISMFTSGSGNGSLAFNLDGGQWRASRFNQAYFGHGVPVDLNEWVNLAMIRSSGQTTFYVDGIAQGAADAAAPLMDVTNFHIGVNPGGTAYFNGDIDNLRIFTFNPATDNPVAALTVNLPEPASIALWSLLGVGAVVFAWRKRRSQARS
jgi:hypothetical protein